jgi:hypothetical protein
MEVSHKEKTAKESEMLQQNIFLRGTDALPGKLREDFEKMLAVHRETLERNLREERKGAEHEREARLVLERETIAKQVKLERERMNSDLEKERSEMKQTSREKEEQARQEVREEMEKMRLTLEGEKLSLRQQVKERDEALLKEKQTRDAEIERAKEHFKEHISKNEMMKGKHEKVFKERNKLKNKRQEENADKRFAFQHHQGRSDSKNRGLDFALETHSEEMESERDVFNERGGEQGLGQNHVRFEAEEAERRRNALAGNEYEEWLTEQRMQNTKQWVEKQCRFAGDTRLSMEGSEGCSDMLGDGNCVDGEDEKPTRCENDADSNKRKNEVPQQTPSEEPLSRLDDPESDDVAWPINPEHPKKCENRGAHPASRDRENNKPDSREYDVCGLKEENEGLKAKVGALQENITLHECFKKEASEEVQRLRDTNKDLKMKLDGLKDTLKDQEELQAAMKDCERKLKDNEMQVKDNKEKIKEYEDICAEYERTLQKCRQRIMVIDNDRASSTVVSNKVSYARNRAASSLMDNNDTASSGRLPSSPGGEIVSNGLLDVVSMTLNNECLCRFSLWTLLETKKQGCKKL